MTVPVGQTDTRPRKRIGRFLVTGRIGRGGMGMVYRGYDESLDREVAIKTLTVEGTFDDESRRRFEIEAKAAARLQHPNILTVYELGESRGVPFIAMELLPGADLEALLRSDEPLLLAEKLEILIQVCRGLAYAHERQIVHRDVKPSNIRVLDDGSAKIMDFGIAKLQGTGVTKAGMMVGTVHYMSPEQIRGRPLDGRSDVFSVGVILYEMLSGKRPFPGQTATEVLYKIVHDPPPPLPLSTDLGPAGSRLDQIVARALAKEPENRYPGANQLADDLSEVVATLGATAGASSQPAEALHQSRRLAREGRLEDALRHLRELAEKHPDSLDVRRALRTTAREITRRQRVETPADDDFPELEETYQAPPTRMAPETLVVPPRESPSLPKARLAAVRWRFVVVAAVGLLALVSGVWLLLPRGRVSRLAVRSQPPGAEMLLDGRPTGVTTDGVIELPSGRSGAVELVFRKSGYHEEARTLKLPVRTDEPLLVTLTPTSARVSLSSDPAGATVSLDGTRLPGTTPIEVSFDPGVEHVLLLSLESYTAREVRLAKHQAPDPLHLKLEPAGPLTELAVASAYPLDVMWRGKVLARAAVSPRVQVPEGKQAVSLSAQNLFLRTTITLDVRAGARLTAPSVGRINIRAVPDNCEVIIDGIPAGYLPILDRAIVVGNHTVVFKWPDGRRAEETAEVLVDRPAYVVGSKD